MNKTDNHAREKNYDRQNITIIHHQKIFPIRRLRNDAFRKRYAEGERRRPLSKAVYDTLSVNFAWLTDNERAILKKRAKSFRNKLVELFNKKDDAFHKSITTATGQKINVKTRFEAIKNIINETLNQ